MLDHDHMALAKFEVRQSLWPPAGVGGGVWRVTQKLLGRPWSRSEAVKCLLEKFESSQVCGRPESQFENVTSEGRR